MPDDEGDAVADELPGGGNRLLGIAEVVRHDETYLLTKYAARRIDVGYRHLRGALFLVAGPCELSRERVREPDQHLRASGATERDDKDSHSCGNETMHCLCPR